jgi:dihydrofolate reductase
MEPAEAEGDTMAKRKIIAYIATSADRYIARRDGDIEWLNRRRPASDYGMRGFYRLIDTILWAVRRTTWFSNFRRRANRERSSTAR